MGLVDEEMIFRRYSKWIPNNTEEESEKTSLYRVFKNNITILTNYVLSISPIDIIQLKAKQVTINQLKLHNYNQYEDWGWSKFSSGKINNIMFDANHTSIIQYPNIRLLTQKLLQLIKENE